jgi:predicted alpha/beta hydrolase family esterase
MKKAILVHGWSHKNEFYDPKYPTLSNSHWFPWLSKQLMIRDVHTVAVEMPKPYSPSYQDWKKEFERFDITPETVLVGHSMGGGFLVRWLSENKEARVGKVILVAPWLGLDPDQDFDASFFDFEIDDKLANRTKGLVVFNSDNDVDEIQKSVSIIRDKLKGIKYKELANKGHFTLKGLGREEFPGLLGEIIS